jgi:hypothetical protein
VQLEENLRAGQAGSLDAALLATEAVTRASGEEDSTSPREPLRELGEDLAGELSPDAMRPSDSGDDEEDRVR